MCHTQPTIDTHLLTEADYITVLHSGHILMIFMILKTCYSGPIMKKRPPLRELSGVVLLFLNQIKQLHPFTIMAIEQDAFQRNNCFYSCDGHYQDNAGILISCYGLIPKIVAIHKLYMKI